MDTLAVACGRIGYSLNHYCFAVCTCVVEHCEWELEEHGYNEPRCKSCALWYTKKLPSQ